MLYIDRETKLEFVRKREMEKQKEREQIIREQVWLFIYRISSYISRPHV